MNNKYVYERGNHNPHLRLREEKKGIVVRVDLSDNQDFLYLEAGGKRVERVMFLKWGYSEKTGFRSPFYLTLEKLSDDELKEMSRESVEGINIPLDELLQIRDLERSLRTQIGEYRPRYIIVPEGVHLVFP